MEGMLTQDEPGPSGRHREKAFIYPLVPFTILLNTYCVTGTVVGTGKTEFKSQPQLWAGHSSSVHQRPHLQNEDSRAPNSASWNEDWTRLCV